MRDYNPKRSILRNKANQDPIKSISRRKEKPSLMKLAMIEILEVVMLIKFSMVCHKDRITGLVMR